MTINCGLMQIFDINTKTWYETEAPNDPHYNGILATGPTGNTVVVIGGNMLEQNSTIFENFVEVYDPETNSWADMGVTNEGVGSGSQI